MQLLTVCIPTYQREALLARCLQSLATQTVARDQYSVLVIDNAGTDLCKKVAADFQATYVYESKAGISSARNRGWRTATTNWILYLDDDALARPELIERLLAHLPASPYAVIGGRYVHHYAESAPPWLVLKNGEGRRAEESATSPIILPAGKYVPGCVIAFKVAELAAINGFQPHLGMTAKNIGFGDEDDAQRRLRKQGKLVCYDPDLVIDHLFQPYKYTLRNQCGMAFQHGKANWYLNTAGPRTLFQLLVRLLVITFYVIPLTLLRWLLSHREWYWQNAFLIVASKYAFAWGYFRASREQHNSVQ